MKKSDTKSINGDVTSGNHLPFWYFQNVKPASFEKLDKDLETDVVIIGGGIAGLSTAYCLTKVGHNVVLVEDGLIGSGETGRTTAHLVTALDDRYYHLEKIFGEEKTKLIAESHKVAIDFVEETVKAENIDCDFERVKGYLFQHPSDKKDSLDRELKAASNAGIRIKKVDETPGMLRDESSLCFSDQAQLHPLKYLNGLCKAIVQKGGKIYTQTHAAKIDHKGITTKEGFTVKAKHIVVATNCAVNNIFTILSKEYAFRTYVIGALIKKGSLPKALWWDTGDFNTNSKIPPYHYVRTHSYDEKHDLIISGGEDHPNTETMIPDKDGDKKKIQFTGKDRYKALEEWTRDHFKIEEVVFKWSGQVLEPMDGIAFIGRNFLDHNNVYIITGDSGNGMTHFSFAGLLIRDLIEGKENKWEKLFSPSRFKIKQSAPAFQMFKEDMKGLVKKLFYKGEKELSSVEKGKAGIVKLEGKTCGAYRDESGKLFLVSAECTHLKCHVGWNSDEKTWDCPCHGSRFTYEGKVINGPANADLLAYTEPEESRVEVVKHNKEKYEK